MLRVRVTDRLWQGSWPRTADDVAEAPWHSVINVCAECVGGYQHPAIPVQGLGVPDGQDPGPAWFDQVVAAYDTLPKPVLIHCGQGISRSSAAVLAVLVARERMTPDAAWAYLQRVHPLAAPHAALWTAWRAWTAARTPR
jgi:protein-tyrosine phosphatase